MPTPDIPRHRTALSRVELSRPVRLALQDGVIDRSRTVFDYGCGLSGDLKRLRRRHIPCAGWDPRFKPNADKVPSDVVNLGYVVNVIEDPEERAEALHGAWQLAGRALVVSARLKADARRLEADDFADGCLTRLGTFQKFYDQSELRAWIDGTLDVRSVPAAPGVFYVFREEQDRQTFLAARYRRSTRAPRLIKTEVIYRKYKPLFEALIAFLCDRGRVPDATELPESADLIAVVGSLRRAFRIVERMSQPEAWERIRDQRSEDLLVHLALARFDRRPKFSDQPFEIQLDVKAFFKSYRSACDQADALLYSAGKMELVDEAAKASEVGKLTGNAFYVHKAGLCHLPPILRVYEGCARAYAGTIEGANIIKLHRRKPKVSYLSYPDFDKDPHPALAESYVVPLQTFRSRWHDYRESANPFILHRKEELVPEGYPRRETYARLTAQEERWGLYEDTARIGTRAGWEEVLEGKGVRLWGHRLVHRSTRRPNESS